VSPIFSHTFEHQHAVELWQFADLSFAVTYGKQTRERIDYAQACTELGQCLMHAAQCAGLIEERDPHTEQTI